MAKQRGTKLIANNKKAYHDYFIEDTYEAGIAFSWNGSEISPYGKMQYQRGVCRIGWR